tara:strand:+ start:108 stop:287 length:180 start_codon:yes stop_codon:yes gene_type:complete
MKLENHVVSLQKKHKELDEFIKKNNLSDKESKKLKKKKLKLKDDIEYCQMKMDILRKSK